MKIARLMIADSEQHADMLYASGIFAPDAFIAVELNGEWHGLFSPLEVDRARRQSRFQHVHLDRPWRDEAEKHGWSGPAGAAAAFLAAHNIKQVCVPGWFPLACAEQLRSQGLRVKAAEGSFFPERSVKTNRRSSPWPMPSG